MEVLDLDPAVTGKRITITPPYEEDERPDSPSLVVVTEQNGKTKQKLQMVRNGAEQQKIHRIPIVSTAWVEVLNVDNPNEIWVRLPHHITDTLVISEPSPHGKTLDQFVNDVKVGMYCMAPLEPSTVEVEEEREIRRRYGRARIIRKWWDSVLSEMFVYVLYIDEGRREWVNKNALAVMPPDFYYHPWQAIRVCLGSVTPYMKHPDTERVWTQEDITALREIVDEYLLFRIKKIDHTLITCNNNVPVVDMYGISEGDDKGTEGVCIATLFAAKRLFNVEVQPVFNADVYETFKVQRKDVEPITLREESVSFPQGWKVEEVPEWKSKNMDNSYAPGETKGFAYSPELAEFQVPNVDVEYLNKHNYIINGTASFVILGSHTVSPYEFYGMLFRTQDSEGNELRFRDSLREINEMRLEKSRTLDAFYSHRDHRFNLDDSEVCGWINAGLRVYAIVNCSHRYPARAKTGMYQRVEILGVAKEKACTYRVRFLDSGGIVQGVPNTHVHRIYAAHCEWPNFAVQLCLRNVCDADPSKAEAHQFSTETLKRFKREFRDDGPIRLTVSNVKSNQTESVRYRNDTVPISYEMWNTMFVIGITMSASIIVSGETDLLKVMIGDGKAIEGRLKYDETQPFPVEEGAE